MDDQLPDDEGIVLEAPREQGRPALPWPAPGPEWSLTTLGQPPEAEPYCFLLSDALAEMLVHGREEQDHEVGGFLLGDWVADTHRQGAVAREIAPALLTESSRVHVTFTHETWTDINARLELYPAGTRIVGWYHTHPGFGPFYSAHDRFIHEHFFADARHLGIVLDPCQQLLSVYGWSAGTVVRAQGLFLCEPASGATSATEVAYVADSPAPRDNWLRRLWHAH